MYFKSWIFSAYVIGLLGAVSHAQNPYPAQPGGAPAASSVRFEDVTGKIGVSASHISSAEKHYIIESVSGGAGVFDCDNDGKLDIVLVNGSTVDRYKAGGDSMVTLYHQDSGFKFTDITVQAGLNVKGWGMGVSVVDFDNDGLLDLYVTGFGHNVLYKNMGGCKFQDVTKKAGLEVGGFSTGSAWADYDKDGNVDLFVSRYVHVDINKLPEFGSNDKFCRFKGLLVQCGPWGMEGESHFLFRNRGDGTFEDVSEKSGLSNPAHRYGLGAVWGDYDNDGWPDLYVANDAGPNFLYHNKHNGTFDEIGLLSGTALSADGQELGSMGVDWGDYDHDGKLDLFVTNFTDQPDNLYRNLGNNAFVDMAWASKTAPPSYPWVKWGTGFVDFDNDGWPDLLVANGHVYPQVDSIVGGAGYRQPAQVFLNKHDGTFADISESSGVGSLPLHSRRGAAFGDLNNDGQIDVVLLNVGDPPTVLLNTTPITNHRALFKLIGVKSNKAAIGARVTVRSGGMMQFNEVRSGASYLSQNDLRLHFGLADFVKMDSVEIAWPSGRTEMLKDVPADFIYTLVEGAGIKDKTALPPVEAAKPAQQAQAQPPARK